MSIIFVGLRNWRDLERLIVDVPYTLLALHNKTAAELQAAPSLEPPKHWLAPRLALELFRGRYSAEMLEMLQMLQHSEDMLLLFFQAGKDPIAVVQCFDLLIAFLCPTKTNETVLLQGCATARSITIAAPEEKQSLRKLSLSLLFRWVGSGMTHIRG